MTSTLRVVAAVLVMSAVLCGCVSAARVQPCKDWVLYKQCGESWSDHELGTAAGVTICDAGVCVWFAVGECVNGMHRLQSTVMLLFSPLRDSQLCGDLWCNPVVVVHFVAMLTSLPSTLLHTNHHRNVPHTQAAPCRLWP